MRFISMRIHTVLALLALPTLPSCERAASEGPSIPSGSYELAAAMGEMTLPVRLDLLAIDERPWGRLAVGADGERVVAVRGIAAAGSEWEFAAGGPVAGLRLSFGDSISGSLSLAAAPAVPLEGRRIGELPDADDLRAHHVLEPLGLAARAGEDGASFPTLTPRGELIFARHGPDLSTQTLVIAAADGEGGWSDPVVLPFSGSHSDRSPAMSPDGSILVFASDRPTRAAADGDEGGIYRLWYAQRSASGAWGDPRPVEFEGGWEHDARQPSIAADGTLYFSSDAPGGRGEGDIYRAEPVSGRAGVWTAPRNLGEPINGPGDEHGAFVAPDGSYLLLTSSGERPGQHGGDDIYLSRRTDDGWSAPRALPLPVNTFANEYGAWLSTDEGRLYLSSDRYGHARLLSVDAEVLGLE